MVICRGFLFAGPFPLRGSRMQKGHPERKIQNHMMKEVLAKMVLLTALAAVLSEICGQDAHEIAARNGAVS